MWYENMIKDIDEGVAYSHRALVEKLKTTKPDLSGNSYQWALNALIRSGKLTRIGYDSYELSTDLQKENYMPNYSETSLNLIEMISGKYPYVQFTAFETFLMNEYLNHLIAQNTIFLQVEKESSIYVFRFLQENGYPNVMYKPSRDDFNLYWSRDCIVVTDLISEAPCRRDAPHSIMLEKMVVDISADKLISLTFSKSEFPTFCEQIQDKYFIDESRMLRYARRRNREKVIMEFFKERREENADTR